MSGFYLRYFFEMVVPVIGMCIPLEKKPHGAWKALIMVAISQVMGIVSWVMAKHMGITEAQSAMDTVGSAYVILWFIILWTLVLVGIYVWVQASVYETIYIFAISYAVEHIFYCIRTLGAYVSGGAITVDFPPMYYPCLIASFFVAYFGFAKPTAKNGRYHVEAITATSASVGIMLVVWFLSLIAGIYQFAHVHSVYAILCCIFILINQRAQLMRENEREEFRQKEQLWKDTKARYEMSKDAMAIVNQHYHDMKHQISALANMESDEKRRGILAEMENDIAIYDAVVHSGNEYLDTVLTEKKLICHSKHIQMSCMADGSQLAFMEEIDFYTLMGNALDNAIEANERLTESQNRWISVQIQNKKGLVLVEIINPYEGNIIMEKDLPKTTKADEASHGYGVHSIKTLTEKYKGQMLIKTENGKYLLRLIFTP